MLVAVLMTLCTRTLGAAIKNIKTDADERCDVVCDNAVLFDGLTFLMMQRTRACDPAIRDIKQSNCTALPVRTTKKLRISYSD